MPRPLLNIPVAAYCPEKAKALCDRLCLGETLTSILRDPEYPSVWSIYTWRDTIPEFGEAYALARERGYDRWAEECMEIAEDGSADWTVRKGRGGVEYEAVDHEVVARSKLRVETRMKLLAMLSPRFRPQQGIQLSNPDGGPVEFTDAAASAKIASLLALAKSRAAGEPEDGSDLA